MGQEQTVVPHKTRVLARNTPHIDTFPLPLITFSYGTACIHNPTGINAEFSHIAGVLGDTYAIIVDDGMIFPDDAMYNIAN